MGLGDIEMPLIRDEGCLGLEVGGDCFDSFLGFALAFLSPVKANVVF